jgi:hypothetical protein
MATAQRGGSLRSVRGVSAARWTARFALAGTIGSAFFVLAISILRCSSQRHALSASE